jgi:hypothetical protein
MKFDTTRPSNGCLRAHSESSRDLARNVKGRVKEGGVYEMLNIEC